jgi:uncharacterized protein (TIGR00251 family)
VPATDTVPFETAASGLRVLLRVQPGASREGVEGLVTLADGQIALKARVCAPPEGGKANAALVKLLAKAWKLPKSAISIVAGHGQRRKTLLVSGDPAALESRLRDWLAGLGESGRR